MSIPRSSICERSSLRSRRASNWRNPDCLSAMILPEIIEEEDSSSFSSQLSFSNRRESVLMRSSKKSVRKSISDNQENHKLLMNEFEDFETSLYQAGYSAPIFELKNLRLLEDKKSRSVEILPFPKDEHKTETTKSLIKQPKVNFSDRFLTPSTSHFNLRQSQEEKILSFSTQSERKSSSFQETSKVLKKENFWDNSKIDELAFQLKKKYLLMLEPVKIVDVVEIPRENEKIKEMVRITDEMTDKYQHLKTITHKILQETKERKDRISSLYSKIQELKNRDTDPGKELRRALFSFHFQFFPLEIFEQLPDNKRWRRIVIIEEKMGKFEVRNHANVLEYPRSGFLTVRKNMNSSQITFLLFEPFKNPDLQSTWDFFVAFLLSKTSETPSEERFKKMSESWLNFLKFSSHIHHFFGKKCFSLTPSKDSVQFYSKFQSFTLSVRHSFDSIIFGDFQLFPSNFLNS